jgi:threonine aldolase
MIDLRSDTVTRPTAAMRRAMAEAEVGDDVYGEDPTVNRLERRAAEILGKEAGLFVPTGTMGNSIGIKVHTQHGQEVICESRAHILDWELSMTAWFSGCLVRPIHAEDGILRWDDVRSALRTGGPHCAPTGLIEIENTHNMAGGTVYPLAAVQEICGHAHDLGIRVHMDGARIFNAACHVNRPVRELAAPADTVMFCLSKGLGAPVGSMLVGTAETIERGRLYRKRLGGGMRQAGVLAAAGLIALEEMPQRLGEDHANARLLAAALAKSPGVQLDSRRVQTNIVIFDITNTGLTTNDISARLKERGVLMNSANSRQMRAVTHYDVTREECATAAAALAEVVSSS